MTFATASQRTGVVSLVGARESNEDSYLLTEHGTGGNASRALLGVADGMGGYEGGDVASRLAIERARDALRCASLDTADLRQAFLDADEAIRAFSRERACGRSMGTTLTIAIVGHQEALVGHVGDSRAWLLHDGLLQQITSDHSRVGRLVRSGTITEAEAIGHPENNVLEKALGTGERAEPDVYRVGIAPGDVLLLTTDGLHGSVGREDIEQALRGPWPMQEVCARLGAIALERGSSDNVTVLGWKCPPGLRTPTIPGELTPPAPPRRPSDAPRAAKAAVNGAGPAASASTQPAPARGIRSPAQARPEPGPQRTLRSAPTSPGVRAVPGTRERVHQLRWRLLACSVLGGFLVGLILGWIGRS